MVLNLLAEVVVVTGDESENDHSQKAQYDERDT
jgi:hypothetical protein